MHKKFQFFSYNNRKKITKFLKILVYKIFLKTSYEKKKKILFIFYIKVVSKFS